MSETIFNRKLSKGRVVVENAFGIMKMSFRELNRKSELDVSFLSDVVTACAILHNILLNQSGEEVQRLLDILQRKRATAANSDMPVVVEEAGELVVAVPDQQGGHITQNRLDVFLC